MEEEVKKIYDKLFDKLRSGDDINLDKDLSFDELIDKYYNLTDQKLPKNHICILRDIFNNDKEFNKIIEYYRHFSEYSQIINFNTPCENCNLKCCNNINVNFNFFSALFVMDLWNRRTIYNPEDNTKLLLLFFKQFYIEENVVKFNEQRMINLFIDYDLEIFEKVLLNNDSLTNIKRLIEVKEVMLSLETRFNNLNDKELEFINQHKLFINRKLEYFEKIYDLEKEEQIHLNNNAKKKKDEKPEHTIRKIKSKIIIDKLNEYGFSELPMLKNIDIEELAIHIFNKKTFSYIIAYLHHLGFIEHFRLNYCKTGVELHQKLAKIIDTTEREVGGNINVLTSRISNDNKTRYKADKHLEKVKKHYQHTLGHMP